MGLDREYERLIVLLGDGTALEESRGRACLDCDLNALPWELEEQSVCKIEVREDLEADCSCEGEGCGPCMWAPFDGALYDWEPVEERSCEDILLSGA